MKLEGMHHVTMITGEAQRNVDFYADVLGLRLVKKTVNFKAPEAYHLYFGDEDGNPPLRAANPEVPAEHAILDVEGARLHRPRAGRRPRPADPDARRHRSR